jgi:hypothetical protein
MNSKKADESVFGSLRGGPSSEFVRSGAGIEYRCDSGDIMLNGDTVIMSGGSLAGLGEFTNGGSMTMVGNAICVANGMVDIDDVLMVIGNFGPCD